MAVLVITVRLAELKLSRLASVFVFVKKRGVFVIEFVFVYVCSETVPPALMLTDRHSGLRLFVLHMPEDDLKQQYCRILFG